MPRDPYEVLGVAKSAEAAAIKAAHRKLVRKHHPDLDKSKGAAERFKEIQEAYETLSDPEKRATYDQFGHAGAGMGQGGFGGHASRRDPRQGQAGGNPFGDIDPGMFDEIFGDVLGRGAGGGRRGRMKAPDTTARITVPFEVAALGGTHHVAFEGPSGPESFDVRIPAGSAQDSQLRIKGKGQAAAGGDRGDLVLQVNIAPHPYFRRHGLDIELDLPISFAESALGAAIDLPLLKGTIKLKVPAGTASGQRLRVKGNGIKGPDGTGGDFFAVIQIVPPREPSADESAQLRAMDAARGNPRQHTRWGK